MSTAKALGKQRCPKALTGGRESDFMGFGVQLDGEEVKVP